MNSQRPRFLISLLAAMVLAAPSHSPAADVPEAAEQYAAIWTTLEQFFTTVEQGQFDAAARLLHAEHNLTGRLAMLQTHFRIYREFHNAVNARSSLAYGSHAELLAITPAFMRDSSVQAIITHALSDGKTWRIWQLDIVPLHEAFEPLREFREAHPDAKGVRPKGLFGGYEVKRYPSTFDREAWDKATQRALRYVKANPPQPRSRRPEALQELSLEVDLAELAAQQVTALAREDSPERSQAVQILSYLGPHAVPACLSALHADSKRQRLRAVHLLSAQQQGTMSDEVLASLAQVLDDDPDVGVREEVVRSLSRVDRAVPILIAHGLSDPELSVVRTTTFQLADSQDRRALQPLLKRMEGEANWQIVHAICSALHTIDAEQAWEPIVAAAQRETDDSRMFQLLRRASLPSSSATYHTGWPNDAADLRRLARHAHTILGESYGEEKYKSLIRGLQHENPYVSSGCLYALKHLGGEAAATAILQQAKRNDANRYTCCKVLAALGTPQAVAYLTKRIRDADRQEREQLTRCLGEADRWAAPLLMVLLADRGLLYDVSDLREPHHRFWRQSSDSHTAHYPLVAVLGRSGFRTLQHNEAAKGRFDLDAEIRNLQAWWEKHGAACLRNELVPSPVITNVYSASN